MMKKLILILSVILPTIGIMTSCEDNSDITNYDKKKLDITLYSNDTSIEGGFTFTANDVWHTNIEYVANSGRSNSDGWITIDPENGEAGTYTLTISTEENLLGENRSAKIKIYCGESVVTIDILQRSTIDSEGNNQEGNDPNIHNPGIYITSITKTYEKEELRRTIYFDRDGALDIIRAVRAEDVTYIIDTDVDHVYINAYSKDDELFGKIEGHIGAGGYLDSATIYHYVQHAPSTGGEVTTTVEKTRYIFYRENGNLIRTEEFEDGEKSNVFELYWEYANNYIGDLLPLNLTKMTWKDGAWKDIITYNTNLSFSNTTSHSKYRGGHFIDLNQFIFYESDGLYQAFGCDILAVLGWVSAPSCNLVSNLKIEQENYTNEISVDYELNKFGLVTKMNLNNGFSYEINYTEF